MAKQNNTVMQMTLVDWRRLCEWVVSGLTNHPSSITFVGLCKEADVAVSTARKLISRKKAKIETVLKLRDALQARGALKEPRR
jgi:hypothetical protein